MKMTKHLLSLIGAAAMATTAGAVTITLDKVQQRYPWNNMVDIDYTLDGAVPDSAIFNVKFTIDGKDYTAGTFLQPFGRTAGKHRVTWDAATDKVAVFTKDATAALSITIEGEKDYNAVIFDLKNGGYYKTNITDTVESWQEFATHDEFKTDYLAMRLIPAKTFTLVATNDWGGLPPRTVSVSSFMIGVYELTQGQYKNITGSESTSNFKGTTLPIEKTSWNTIRCSATGTYDYMWPSMGHQVAANSVCGKFRTLTSKNGQTEVAIDLPTEAQWSAAAQGKTSSTAVFGEIGGYEVANGTTQNAAGHTLNEYVVSSLNSGSKTAAVGSKLPNSYGLFDTIGNVWEFCLDQAMKQGEVSGGGTVQADPIGGNEAETTAAPKNRVRRGGSWNFSPVAGITSLGARARDNAPSFANVYYGFRLASPVLAD